MNSATGKFLAGCLEKYCGRGHGRLSLRKGEGRVSRVRSVREIQPLTLALSLFKGEADFF
jgi:hypothetical protein